MAEKEEKEMEEAIRKVDANQAYKVLTKEEYDILMGGAKPKITSTPRVSLTPKTPKVPFAPRTPGATPTRLQQLINTANQSFTAVPTYNPPKLPFFSGSDEPAKGETSYKVWSYEVKCLQKSEFLSEQVLLHSIRTSLRGAARDLLIPLGEDASVDEVLDKLDGFYGNVSSAETIIQSFYSDYQKENESVATFGSHLEQTLSRAIRYGHMELAAKDSMLRSKFWTGLRSQQLRNSTRYLYDTHKDFPSLLREIRKVKQEESCSQRPVQPTVLSKQKVAQQHSSQVPTDQSDNSTSIQKQMSDLMSIVKSLEKKMESQQQALAAANNSSSSQQDFNYQSQRGRGQGFRGYWRGNFGRGNSGTSGGNYQNNNLGGFRGYRSRGRGYGGAKGCGANWGGSSNQSGNSLN